MHVPETAVNTYDFAMFGENYIRYDKEFSGSNAVRLNVDNRNSYCGNGVNT